MKFPSLWNTEEDIPEQIEEKTAEEPAAEVAEAEDDDSADEEEDETAEGEAASEAEGDEGDEGDGEEYEFSEDDSSKAFTMLIDEGVLELDDDEDLENSPKGVADAVAATIRKKVQSTLAAIPDTVQSYYAHIQGGGEPSSFKFTESRTNWGEFEPSTEDKQKQAIKAHHLALGLTQEEAQEEVDDAEAAGKLERKSEIAVTSLAKTQAKAEKADADAKKAASDAASKKSADEVKELKKLIDTSEDLAGFKLDAKTKAAFKDHLFKVDKRSGKTQLQQNMEDQERTVTTAFLDFVNYTKTDLEKAVASELTSKRKKKLARFTSKNSKTRNSSATVKSNVKNKSGHIKFASIFGTQNIETED